MPEPMRMTMMKALTDQIATRAGLENKVYRGKAIFGPSNGDDLQVVSIFEDGANAVEYHQQAGDGTTGVVPLQLIVMGYDIEDPVHPTDPAMLMMYRVTDAIKAIKRDGAPTATQNRNYLGLGRVIDDIEVGFGHVYPAFSNELTSVAFFQIPVTVHFLDV